MYVLSSYSSLLSYILQGLFFFVKLYITRQTARTRVYCLQEMHGWGVGGGWGAGSTISSRKSTSLPGNMQLAWVPGLAGTQAGNKALPQNCLLFSLSFLLMRYVICYVNQSIWYRYTIGDKKKRVPWHIHAVRTNIDVTIWLKIKYFCRQNPVLSHLGWTPYVNLFFLSQKNWRYETVMTKQLGVLL